MKDPCAILGTGPSLRYFAPNKYAYAIGANDTYMFAPCQAICVTDTVGDIKAKRSGFFHTPDHVEKFFIKNKSWTKFVRENKNARIISTKRIPFGDRGKRDKEGIERLYERIPLTPNGGLWHGYHTPFFSSQVAISKDFINLHYYGIDGGCFTGIQQQMVIDELNFLHHHLSKQGGGVWLCSNSELWGFDYNMIRKLNVNRL